MSWYRWSDDDLKFTLDRLISGGIKYATLETQRMDFSNLLELKKKLESRGHIVRYYKVGCNMDIELVQPTIKLEYPIGYLIGKQVMWKSEAIEGRMYFGEILRIENNKVITTTKHKDTQKELSVNSINETWWLAL